MSLVKISRFDNGRTIDVVKGDQIEVKLAENRTTGFCWQVLDCDDGFLAQDKGEYQPFDTSPEPTPGSGGECTLRFQTKKAGQARIRLGLRQPWEPDTVDDEFTVSLNISAD